MPFLRSHKIGNLFSSCQSFCCAVRPETAAKCTCRKLQRLGKILQTLHLFLPLIIYSSLRESWLSTVLLQWPVAICFKVGPRDWIAHPHVASHYRDGTIVSDLLFVHGKNGFIVNMLGLTWPSLSYCWLQPSGGALRFLCLAAGHRSLPLPILCSARRCRT